MEFFHLPLELVLNIISYFSEDEIIKLLENEFENQKEILDTQQGIIYNYKFSDSSFEKILFQKTISNQIKKVILDIFYKKHKSYGFNYTNLQKLIEDDNLELIDYFIDTYQIKFYEIISLYHYNFIKNLTKINLFNLFVTNHKLFNKIFFYLYYKFPSESIQWFTNDKHLLQRLFRGGNLACLKFLHKVNAINIFEIFSVKDMIILIFNQATINIEYLKFIVENRNNDKIEDKFDYMIYQSIMWSNIKKKDKQMTEIYKYLYEEVKIIDELSIMMNEEKKKELFTDLILNFYDSELVKYIDQLCDFPKEYLFSTKFKLRIYDTYYWKKKKGNKHKMKVVIENITYFHQKFKFTEEEFADYRFIYTNKNIKFTKEEIEK